MLDALFHFMVLMTTEAGVARFILRQVNPGSENLNTTGKVT